MPLRVTERIIHAWRTAKSFLPERKAPPRGAPPVISPPTIKIFTTGSIRSEDITDTPLYRAYVKLNDGRPLPRFDAEVTWGDDLAKDVLARQLGEPFAALSDEAFALLRIKSIYEKNQEILMIFDRKSRLAPLAEDFIEKRVQLAATSYESFFLIDLEGDRVHLEKVNNLLMLETLDLLLRRHFPGYTITAEAANYQAACWIAQKFEADFLNSSSKNYPRLVKRLEEAGVLLPEKAEEILAAENAFAAYCLLNGALHRDDSGQTPLEYLLFLIEHIPVPKEDLPQLAVEGKIPIS